MKKVFEGWECGEKGGLLDALNQLAKDPDWKIFKNTVVGGDGMLPTYSSGGEYAYVMTQDYESIENAKTLINAVLDGQRLQTDENGSVTVVSGE